MTLEGGGSADLYRIHPDGTSLERLTDDPAYDDQPAFSPDGERIAFVSTRANGQTNLWILDVATRKATPLTAGQRGDFRPSWSLDGAWIAFSSDRDPFENTPQSGVHRPDPLGVSGFVEGVLRLEREGFRHSKGNGLPGALSL